MGTVTIFKYISTIWCVYVLNYFPINIKNVDKAAYASGQTFVKFPLASPQDFSDQ